jgi:hypothetical protein
MLRNKQVGHHKTQQKNVQELPVKRFSVGYTVGDRNKLPSLEVALHDSLIKELHP